MGEIADVGPRARDYFAICVDQRIGLAHQRLDLDREAALQPFGASGADRRKALRNALERRKTEPDLEHCDQEQNEAEQPKGDQQRPVEIARLLVDLGCIAGHGDKKTTVLAKIDAALDGPQQLIFGALDVALASPP